MKDLLFISGGGTGGHVSPGLGVAREWAHRHGAQSVAWVGRPQGIEKDMAEKAGLPYRVVESAALRRGLAWKNLALPWTLLKGSLQARRLLKADAPKAVLLTGGYVGLPLGLAAISLGLPLVLLEPNAVPGLANRLLWRFSRRLCLAYPGAGQDARRVLTGTPSRLGVLPTAAEGKRVLGLAPSKRTLLVLPGSQAARAINAALREALPSLRDRASAWQWIWMCGAAELDACRSAAQASGLEIQVQAFIHDVASAYAASDLVLCRSGASTLAELALAARPSLQVPYPHATGGHQRANAKAFEAAGASRLIEEKDLNGPILARTLRELLDGDVLPAMAGAAAGLARPHAAVSVADEIETAAAEAA